MPAEVARALGVECSLAQVTHGSRKCTQQQLRWHTARDNSSLQLILLHNVRSVGVGSAPSRTVGGRPSRRCGCSRRSSVCGCRSLGKAACGAAPTVSHSVCLLPSCVPGCRPTALPVPAAPLHDVLMLTLLTFTNHGKLQTCICWSCLARLPESMQSGPGASLLLHLFLPTSHVA